jgi:K+-transporting ATPase KdpF subunit
MSAMVVVALVVTVALFGYLVGALLWPEKF